MTFELARQVASQSNFGKAHVGCTITYKGRPVVSSCNMEKTHPLQKKYNRYREKNHREQNTELAPKVHAEINALSKIMEAGYDSRKLDVYVYRIRKDRAFGMARPCAACMKAIRDMGIRNIYYTTNEGYAHEVLR